jgi:hypothetical protein
MLQRLNRRTHLKCNDEHQTGPCRAYRVSNIGDNSYCHSASLSECRFTSPTENLVNQIPAMMVAIAGGLVFLFLNCRLIREMKQKGRVVIMTVMSGQY